MHYILADTLILNKKLIHMEYLDVYTHALYTSTWMFVHIFYTLLPGCLYTCFMHYYLDTCTHVLYTSTWIIVHLLYILVPGCVYTCFIH